MTCTYISKFIDAEFDNELAISFTTNSCLRKQLQPCETDKQIIKYNNI